VPGSTPAEAVESYLAPIRETLSCVSETPITNFGGVYVSEIPHRFTFVGKPPISYLQPPRLSIFVSQRYTVRWAEETDEYRVRTQGYIYQLTEEDQEILSYHWHPDQHDIHIPHLHFKRGAMIQRSELIKTHIPTGRVALESFVEYIISDFRAEPRHQDYKRVLEGNRKRFEAYKTW